MIEEIERGLRRVSPPGAAGRGGALRGALGGRRLACLVIAAILFGGFAFRAPSHAAESQPLSFWSEITWPFLRDAWPSGRAFRCEAEQCGVELALYARVKVGFCDCSRGVSDDDEIDRVGDVDLVNRNFAPLATGDPVKISGIYGRKRLYVTKEAKPRRVMVFAGGRNCNAFVAMAVAPADFPPEAVDAAEALLDEPAFMRWVVDKEGGG